MVSGRTAVPRLALVAGAIGLSATGAGVQAAPHVNAAVQVTTPPAAVRGHAIPVIAVHPDNDRVVAIAEAETRSSRCSIHVSTDAGASWTQGTSPQPAAAPRCVRNTEGPISDLAFSPDGTLYYAFPGWRLDDWHSQIYLARSTDLGRRGRPSASVATSPTSPGYAGSNALPSVRVDPDQPSRVYVAWSSNYGLWNMEDQVPGGAEASRTTYKRRPYIAVSNDGGKTFSRGTDIAGSLTESLTQPTLAVGRNGAVYAFFNETQVTEFGDNMRRATSFRPSPPTPARPSARRGSIRRPRASSSPT